MGYCIYDLSFRAMKNQNRNIVQDVVWAEEGVTVL